MYTDLIFDLYGTLVDIHTEENDQTWEKTALYFGFYGARYSPEALRAAFEEELRRRQAVAGQGYECFPDIPVEEVMAQLFRARGVAGAQTLGFHAAQLLRICSLDFVRLCPGVRAALGRLRAAGCRLWLLTNAQRAFTAYELKLLDLGAEFDGIYISSDVGCCKPDSRFYQALLQAQGLDPARCLMIGNDRQTDIAGAKQLGLATLYMHTALTPPDQAPADPALAPGTAPENCRHWEYEGWDWETLSRQILAL